MIPRDAAHTVRNLAQGYPVIGITGPRQSGKTTLCRALFPRHQYVSLLSFWRDRSGHEVDLIVEHADRLQPVEIKAGATVTGDWLKGLRRWMSWAGDAVVDPTVVHGGRQSQEREGIRIIPWNALSLD